MCITILHLTSTPTTHIYTLSLHDALPISTATHTTPAPTSPTNRFRSAGRREVRLDASGSSFSDRPERSEEHTSELQSPCNLVCRLLLEKKNNNKNGYGQHTAATYTDRSVK